MAFFGSKKTTAPEAKPEAAKPAPVAAAARPEAAAVAPAAALSPEEAKRRAAASQLSSAFAQVVSILMRSPRHKHFSLADLEWLVVPPLLTGQCRIGEVRLDKDGLAVPAGVVLWASVSHEVDKRLATNLDAPIRLRPDEWKSGDNLWLIDVAGDMRVISAMVKHLCESVLKGRNVKARRRNKEGKPTVELLLPGA